jgi:DNA-binding winged helix-turn-helix (wHTH) protein/TolB-like protein/Flp pilus assembly protein TadD
MANAVNNLRQFGEFRLDPEKRVLWHGDDPVQVPVKEIELLSVLTEKAGEVVTKSELMDRVWADSFVEESNLSRHVYRLRKIFAEFGESRELIQTVPRRGYRFAVPVDSIRTGEVVYERHSLTRTLIEEIHSSDPKPEIASPTSSAFTISHSRPGRIATAAGLIVLILAGAYFGYYRQSAAAERSQLRSIAVLPFNAIDETNGSRELGFGMTDLVISRLSNVSGLSVRPTSAVSDINLGSIDVREIGQKLQVGAVIEGSIYQTSDGVRVIARLVRTGDNSTVWSREFISGGSDLLTSQTSIASEIAEVLAIELSNNEVNALTRRYTDVPEAQRLYAKARYLWTKRDHDSFSEATKHFRAATETDPKFALAWVGLADSTIFAEDASEAEFALKRALALDPNLGEAYATRGFIQMFHYWKWNEAEADLRKAIELNPGYGPARQWYGTLLVVRRRFDEAKEQLRAAIAIDPTSPNYIADLGHAFYYAGEFNAARDHCRRALSLRSDFQYASNCLADVYFATGDHAEMLIARNAILASLSPGGSVGPAKEDLRKKLSDELDELADLGPRPYFEKLAKHLETSMDRNANKHIVAAKAHLFLGDHNTALTNLELAVRGRAFIAPFINADPVWEPFRGDPRFTKLIAELGL